MSASILCRCIKKLWWLKTWGGGGGEGVIPNIIFILYYNQLMQIQERSFLGVILLTFSANFHVNIILLIKKNNKVKSIWGKHSNM